jgi:hypothetical protein
MVKPGVLPQRRRVVRMCHCRWSSLCVLIMTNRVGGVGPRRHHYYLYATSTLVLHSLSISGACRVADSMDGLHTQA